MTKRWGRLDDDNKVHEITDIDPAGRFAPDLKWVELAADVREGAQFNPAGGAFVNPPEPEIVPVEPPAPNRKFSKVQFFKLLTMEERAGIRTASATDAVVADVLYLIDNAAYIDVTDPDTVAGVQYMASKGLLKDDRAADILAAVNTNPF